MTSDNKYRVLQITLYSVGVSFIFVIGIPTLFTIKSLIIFAGIPWPETSLPALFFMRHAGAAWIGWGLVFVFAATNPQRYLSVVKICFFLMILDVVSSIVNISYEGVVNLSRLILTGYVLGVVVFIIMAFTIPWEKV